MMLEHDRAFGPVEVGPKPVDHELIIEMHGHGFILDADLEVVPLSQRTVDCP